MSDERLEFEAKLEREFPNLYADMHGSMRNTCMCWGIDTGPGWYPLIYRLSKDIEAEILKLPEDQRPEVKASQVKEKYGTLRFYMTSETDEISRLISEAEDRSAEICDSCGKPGRVVMRQGWYRATCEECGS